MNKFRYSSLFQDPGRGTVGLHTGPRTTAEERAQFMAEYTAHFAQEEAYETAVRKAEAALQKADRALSTAQANKQKALQEVLTVTQAYELWAKKSDDLSEDFRYYQDTRVNPHNVDTAAEMREAGWPEWAWKAHDN